MKNLYSRIQVLCIFSIALLNSNLSTAQTLTRGPYLNSGSQTEITIRWRSSAATNSKVTWGTVFGTYPNAVTQDQATTVTEHIVRITGLTADTKYFYTIGSTTATLQQTNTNYFITLPPDGSTRKLRFMAYGDCGTGSTNATNTKNTFLNFIGTNNLDGLLLLGDNAYSTGTDVEYTSNFFNMYGGDMLRYNKLYPAPGNHDYGNNSANTGNTGTTPALSMAYHKNFTTPMAGELGGVASGAKNFYSYNIGNVHFVSLDSYGKDNSNTTKMYDTTGLQATWLKADLAANTKMWTIVYFHHAPYTKTSHNSDTELDLVAVREKFNTILERFGVDLVICGHAHGYERSYLLKNYYNNYAAPKLDIDFNLATNTATGTNQNATYDGTTGSNAFTYNSGKSKHGTVYIVAGSSGQTTGTPATGYPLECMYYSNYQNSGCFYFEVDSNRLDAKFVSYTTAPTPVIRDKFTIFKDVKKRTNVSILLGAQVTARASWRGTYKWAVDATAIAGQTAQSYTVTPAGVGTFDYIVSDDFNDLKDTTRVTVSLAPLPILINSFTAKAVNNKVQLDWSTDLEENNKYFTIEHSTDGVSFQVLGKVNGAVNSSIQKSYSMVDAYPADGVNYYRLSQTDVNNHQTYFQTRQVNFKGTRSFTSTVINLPNGKIKVVISNNKTEKLNFKIVNMLGEALIAETISVVAGNNTKELQLPSGTYILTLTNSGGEKKSNKIIVQ